MGNPDLYASTIGGAMTNSSSWFDDDTVFESEVRRALSTPRHVPEFVGYSDVREIARGGQGVVYSAYQISTRRVVAIKVLRETPQDGSQGYQRFGREVALAASLRHPNLVALFDSGTLNDGRPYLVMELVDGPTLEHAPAVLATQQSNHAREPLEEMLSLFIEICAGVDYAHRRGIVHRDLKPSNVRIDSEGRPKVLDFGLAKDLSSAGEVAALTMTATGGAFLGSVPWASPEQALGKTRAIHARSDVYALGVMLYQLLTEHFPYDVESDLRTALDAIVHQPPQRLRRFKPTLHVDLETIVLRCLQKDPARRYQSAAALAEDLERYIAGEAIEARRDSTWYVLRTTARRHRGLVAATLLIIIALAGGLIASLYQWQRAEEGLELANQNARRATGAIDYFTDTLMAIDPDRDGPETKVLDLVQRAASDLKERFPHDPDTRDFFYIKLIELLRNLGQQTQALELANQAVESAELAFGSLHPSTIFARSNRALLLHRCGRSAEAVLELEACAAIARTDVERYRTAVAHIFVNLGSALAALDRIDDAEKAFQEGIAFEKTGNMTGDQVAISQESLAAIAGHRGNFREAIRLLRLAVDLRVQHSGKEHSSTLTAISNLAYYLAEADDLEEALQMMDRALIISRRRGGDLSLQTLSLLNNRGNYNERLGRLEEAALDYEECLSGRLEILGETHPHTLITWGNIASLDMMRGNYESADKHFLKLIDISIRQRGASHSDTLILRNNYAACLGKQERLDEALAIQEDIKNLSATALGEESYQTAIFLGNAAVFKLRQGNPAACEPELRESIRILELRLGKRSAHAIGFRQRLIQLLRETGREAEATELERAEAAMVAAEKG